MCPIYANTKHGPSGAGTPGTTPPAQNVSSQPRPDLMHPIRLIAADGAAPIMVQPS